MRIRFFPAVIFLAASAGWHALGSQQGVGPETQRTSAEVSAARARVHGDTLEFVFPAIAEANVGCALLNSPALQPGQRRYYWLASAFYRGTNYPNNHFQTVGINLELPPDLSPTKARLDSAIAGARVDVGEGAGEPPMQVHATRPERTRSTVEALAIEGRTLLRVRLVVEGKDAVRAFVAAGSDSVTLGWCQRDRSLSSIGVPLERQ